ncbi:hypothetical protein HDU98_005180, partial [Podochytrium sp. JEL0797]
MLKHRLSLLLKSAASSAAQKRQLLCEDDDVIVEEKEATPDFALAVAALEDNVSEHKHNNEHNIDAVSEQLLPLAEEQEHEQEQVEHVDPNHAEQHAKEQRRRADLLIVEHFEFNPSDLIDEIVNAVNIVANDAMAAFEEFMIENIGEDLTEEGLCALVTLVENSIDKYFDKFELFANKNIFSIPQGLRITLPQYEDIDPSLLPISEPSLDTTLTTLHHQIASAQFYNATVSTSLTSLESTNTRLAQLLAQMHEITDACRVPADASVQSLEALRVGVSGMEKDEEYVNGVL